MSLELLQQRGIYLIPPEKFKDYHIRTIDAIVISARAWLYCILFVSFLEQTMIDYFNHFSSW